MNELLILSTGLDPNAQQEDVIILDGSGSMQSKWWESLYAIDSYVAQCQQSEVQSHVTLSVFSGSVLDDTVRDCSIDAWIPLAKEPIGSTWGGTPLYNAINAMGRRLRETNPSRCSILIVTDGQDSMGGEGTSVEQAKQILDWLRAKGYQVTFIGCDFNNASQAARLGSSVSESVGVAKGMLVDAAKALATKRAVYGKTGAPMHWSPDEQQQFGGYLAAPEKS